MCAVIGAYVKDITDRQIQQIKQLFIESQVRGRHATGVSYLKNNFLETISEPIPAEEFIKNHNIEDMIDDENNLKLIGHCRYSTSDLAYNQPISNDIVSIVHNGVITQELPENWERLWKFKCKTKNDSELILKVIEKGVHPLTYFPNSSMSVITLNKTGKMEFYRNGKRPLHSVVISSNDNCQDSIIVGSTDNILRRSGFEILPSTDIIIANSMPNWIDNEFILFTDVKISPRNKDYQND